MRTCVGHTISGVQIWWTYCQIAYCLDHRTGINNDDKVLISHYITINVSNSIKQWGIPINQTKLSENVIFESKKTSNPYAKNQEIFILSILSSKDTLNDSNQAGLKTSLNQSLQNEDD